MSNVNVPVIWRPNLNRLRSRNLEGFSNIAYACFQRAAQTAEERKAESLTPNGATLDSQYKLSGMEQFPCSCSAIVPVGNWLDGLIPSTSGLLGIFETIPTCATRSTMKRTTCGRAKLLRCFVTRSRNGSVRSRRL